MQQNSPGVVVILVTIWFFVSGFAAMFSTIVIWFWLRRRTKIDYYEASIPGKLEYVYRDWCKEQGQPPNKFILYFRSVTFISAAVAAIILILIIVKIRYMQ